MLKREAGCHERLWNAAMPGRRLFPAGRVVAGVALLLAGCLIAAPATLARPAQTLSPPDTPNGRVCGTNLVVSRSMTLEPGCRYTGTTTIAGSNLVLDCRGATLDAEFKTFYPLLIGDKQRVTDVEVRNCTATRGLGSGVFVGLTLKDDKKPLGPDGRPDYNQHPQRITLRGVTSSYNRNGGFYVDDYVQEVSILASRAEGNGSTGIYLEHSSRRNRVADTQVVRNGFGAVPGAPNSRPATREGIAVDSSADNIIENNTITGNKAGGIYLYRNCGEQPDNPHSVPRWQPSNGNVIRGNTIDGGRVGIWVASRQEMEVKPSACRLRPNPTQGVFPDAASGNTVTGNIVRNVDTGIRVSDDDNTVDDNRVEAGGDCLMLGSAQRDRMRHPVRNLTIRGNACQSGRVNVIPNTLMIQGNGPMTR